MFTQLTVQRIATDTEVLCGLCHAPMLAFQRREQDLALGIVERQLADLVQRGLVKQRG
jgi:hypothetical protein